MKQKYPLKVFSNEFWILLGVLATATAIAYLGKALDNGSGHFSILFLIATFIYGITGYLFPSHLVWAFALITLGAWFGTETGYSTGWDAYFHGMNYPLRYVLFGAVLTGAGFFFKHTKRFRMFHRSTYMLGFLYMFVSLWLLSIFGNFGSWTDWEKVEQIQLISWSFLFAFVAIAAIVFGLKTDDSLARSYGVTFLFINLYTRFFEYFWEETHKAIFFLILAITFWIIGKNAEKIWTFKFSI